VIERSAASSNPGIDIAGAAQRRVFRSKVDTIRPTYGFDDVSLAPGTDTIEPADVDLAQSFAGLDLAVPILASAMDAVVDAWFAGALARLGGLAVLNLEWVQTRFDDPGEVLERIATAPDADVQAILADAYQQPAEDETGAVLRLRRVVLKLDQPTRDGDTEVALLSNLWDEGVDALTLARLYLKRWTIETAFQVLTETLDCEQPRLGYPKAALFAFCVTLVCYNVLAVVKAALRAAHGCAKVEQEVSLYHVTEQVRRTYTGMMIALPEEEWVLFQGLSVPALAQILRELASRVRLAAVPKAPSRPKKPRPERKDNPKEPHVSTAKVLGQRRQQ